ncbi:restriction endonuclease subunit S [Capnocytophaga leadbetteri]|uniref:restriction endonuclease subunit S n=1 Tax=Capnocytophaga leadbetteri TaxID=327575 RepID=UPI0028D1DB24|nr:restriction endonuclease subunit S [Capnocytophaga leadbetteri]
MLSKEIQEQLNTKASATTIAILNKSKFENTLIPLPPLAEQHRIVKKIETYFSFFDTIESNL